MTTTESRKYVKQMQSKLDGFFGINNLMRRTMIKQERHAMLSKQREDMLQKLSEKERVRSFDFAEENK